MKMWYLIFKININHIIIKKLFIFRKYSKESLLSKEKVNINYESLYQDSKDTENEAIQARIETYELKGINGMEPIIKNLYQSKLEKTSMSTLYEKKI